MSDVLRFAAAALGAEPEILPEVGPPGCLAHGLIGVGVGALCVCKNGGREWRATP